MRIQISLGTAQFGLAYGITNGAGQVTQSEVRALLDKSASAGLSFLDTAQAYGDAETVLGRTLKPDHGFKLISKLQPQTQLGFTAEDPLVWEQAFQASCSRMGVQSLHAFLLHSPGDLRKPGCEHLRDWLLSLRERGLVQRLGLSIYSSSDLECPRTAGTGTAAFII